MSSVSECGRALTAVRWADGYGRAFQTDASKARLVHGRDSSLAGILRKTLYTESF
jgi:hypothetical protein